MQILEADRLDAQRSAVCFSVRRGGITPIGLPWLSVLAEPLDIGVAVLRDDCGYPLGMLHRQPQPRGRAIVEDVEHVAGETERIEEVADYLGEMIEAVFGNLERSGLHG
jgi:hypothetical protein